MQVLGRVGASELHLEQSQKAVLQQQRRDRSTQTNTRRSANTLGAMETMVHMRAWPAMRVGSSSKRPTVTSAQMHRHAPGGAPGQVPLQQSNPQRRMVQRRPRHVGDMPTFSEDAWGRWPFDGGLFGDFDKQLEEIMEAFHGPPMTTEAREDEFVITGEVPGMSPDQVQVEVKDGHLVITGESPRMRISRSFKLPPDTPVNDIQAQCEHGVLMVHVPRKKPTQVPVEPVPEEFKEEHGSVITLQVPGFTAEDIEISVGGQRLHIEGKNAKEETFQKEYRLLDDAAVDKIAARCSHGILQVLVPLVSAQRTEVDVASTIDVSDEDTEHFHSMQFAVPGLRPQDVRISIEGGIINIVGERTEGYKARFQKQLQLPREVDPQGVRAMVQHGVLSIAVPTPTRKGPASPMKIPVVTSNRPGATSESESGSVEVSVDDQA
eukprot:scaffold574_cov333-Pavlova_lutheri.AAC.41